MMFALPIPRRNVAAGVALLAIVLGAVWFGAGYLRGPRTYTVVLKDGGFTPAELTVKNGDTVVFRNESSHSMWPASDPHPTHTDLAGFDSRKSIETGAQWSYTFNEPGSWRYHDHYDVSSRGEIFVVGKAVRLPDRAAGYCGGRCFDELVRETVRTAGIDAAYELFQDTYEQGELPRGCHWTAHQIGEAAYELYRSAESFPVTIATSYCGYGFYHGFLEKLLREDPDVSAVLRFCDVVKSQLGDLGEQNCFHGIGHGYTEDPPDPAYEGDFDAMLKPGIAMCERLFGNDFRDLNVCLTGVYTVPVGFAASGEYGLRMDPDDPFALCKDQPYEYKKACYGEFAAKLDMVLDWDIRKLPQYVRDLHDDKLERLVTWVVPSVMMAKDILAEDHSRYIDSCRDAFDGQLREICWGGTILGFFQHGEPEKQYVQIMDFCRSPSWRTDGERAFCWGEGFRQMRQNYGPQKVAQLCSDIPDRFRDLCLDEKGAHVSPYDDPSFATP